MFYRKITSSRIFRQYLAGLLCSLSMLMLGNALDWTAPAIPKLQGERPDVNLTNNEISWMASILYLGNMLSPIPSGYSMDRFGRKQTLLCTTVLYIISCVILYFAVSPYHFYVARFLSGVVNGVVLTITPVYIGEISEPKIRGSVGGTMSVIVTFSAVYIYAIGFYNDYEGFVIGTLLVPAVFLLTFIWMPETPHYYLKKNKKTKAVESLTWLRCDKTKDEVANELNIIDLYVKEQAKSKSSFKEVISNKANRKALLIILFVSSLFRFSGIETIIGYSPLIIPKNSISFLSRDLCINILGIEWFLLSIMSLKIDRFNRRTLLILSSFGTGVTNIVISAWFYLNDKTEFTGITQTYTWIPYISLICGGVFLAMGIRPLSMSMRGELFATNIKGKASALTAIIMGAASFINVKFFFIITDAFGMYLNFLIFSVSCFVSIIIIYFYVIETRGKTLEEIQDELNGIQKKEIFVKNCKTKFMEQ